MGNIFLGRQPLSLVWLHHNKGVRRQFVVRLGRFVIPHAGRPASSSAEVPVLCRLWRDEGEWNAAAVDLPVAVSARGLEEAQRHLRDAIVCRLRALQQSGQFDSEVGRLKQIARECKIATEEMSDCELWWRITARVVDHKSEDSCNSKVFTHSA